MVQDKPIFFDPSGRRWRRAKRFAVLFVFSVVVISAALALLALQRVEISRANVGARQAAGKFAPDERNPAELAYSMDNNLPVIGRGVFLRVVRLDEQNGQVFAADVYTGQTTKQLTEGEKQAVGNQKYAIERYGATSGKHIVLTFDDGPDPLYTPQILDILSAESAHSTFFPIGSNIVKYPEIARRITREGHDFANHTFSHADLDLVSSYKAKQEINLTQRVIRKATGINPVLFRIPYGGNDDDSVRDDKRAILEAQRLGYTVVSYDIDSQDWGFDSASDIMVPELDGSDKVILLHDSGGNRTHTVGYLRELIPRAKAAGYAFTSLTRLFADYDMSQPARPDAADTATYYAATAAIVWPKKIVHGLFIISMALVFLSVVVGIIFAELQMVLMKPARRRNGYYPLVSVIIPAYNEEKVLKRTVKAILSSHYRNIEVIIVDDGSKDGTWRIAQELQSKKRVRAVHQRNAGKAVAVNRGIKLSKGDIIVNVDADTVFAPQTVGKLARYFYYPEIGAVAGVVKVGNIKNFITRWQALEYITSINIERAAQAFIRSITVAPGACSAWRKGAILKAGGYSSATLAEDCDLTLAVQKAGYTVTQDMGAVAYTESPETLRNLAKQRFRWLFGNIQAIWKHRDMVFRKRYGWLGMYTLPKSVFSIVMQVIFTPVLLLVMLGNLLAGEVVMLLFYMAVANVILIITAVVALVFARERFSYLTATPAFRLIYSPLRTMLIYASVLAALGGLELGWNKVVRTGTAISMK